MRTVCSKSRLNPAFKRVQLLPRLTAEDVSRLMNVARALAHGAGPEPARSVPAHATLDQGLIDTATPDLAMAARGNVSVAAIQGGSAVSRVGAEIMR